MDDTFRRKLALLAERAEGKDISIMKEVRLDHRIEDLREITPESLCQAIAQVLSRPLDEVCATLAKYRDNDLILDELVEGLSKR